MNVGASMQTSVPVATGTGLEAELEHVRLEQLRRLSFPSADMLRSAAAMFQPAGLSGLVDGWVTAPGGETRQYRTPAEGPWPRLEIAPGLVRLTRVDMNRAEKSAERRVQADLARDMSEWEADESEPTRFVSAWSPKSRARMVATIASLDLRDFVTNAASQPVMVTLTLPGKWLDVAPTAAVAAKKFDNFARAWRHQWGVAPQWIWKREFQRRGAPHWHIWTTLPTGDHQAFREWLSAAWTHALDIGDLNERKLSLKAGTGLDFAIGLRARDPKRLAIYFLKESLGGEGKSYQNAAPREWAGQSIGRFWGYRGLDKAVVSVAIDPNHAQQLWRSMRKIRSAGVTYERYVDRVNSKTGTVRRRKVRRRVKVGGQAGWLAVNSGANTAAALARWLDILMTAAEAE